jgi:hypothetical protein
VSESPAVVGDAEDTDAPGSTFAACVGAYEAGPAAGIPEAEETINELKFHSSDDRTYDAEGISAQANPSLDKGDLSKLQAGTLRGMSGRSHLNTYLDTRSYQKGIQRHIHLCRVHSQRGVWMIQ